MPRQKSPERLYRLCIASVAGNVRHFCREHELFDDCFPRHVNEDLVEEVCSKRDGDLDSLLHLLTHKLSRVKLGSLHTQDAISLLHPISLHGARLSEVSLTITGHDEEGPDLKAATERLVYLISHLPEHSRLKLNLSGTPIGNEVLAAIAHHCPRLVELELSSQFTADCNDGLRLLVQCRDLDSLTLEELGDNHFTVATFVHLLNGLPQLQHLHYHPLRKVFPELPETSRLRLTKLNLTECEELTEYGGERELFLSRKELGHIVKICPHLTDLSFSIMVLSDDAGADVPAMDEEGPVKSPLEPIGSKLTRLELSACFLDIGALARSCPVLVELQLRLGHFINYKSPFSFGFPRLRVLGFTHENDDFSAEKLVEVLRRSTDLEVLTITSGKLTDSGLSFLVSSGILSKVRHLSIESAGNVSVTTLMEVVPMLGNLTVLQPRYMMPRAYYRQLREFVEDQRLQVEIRTSLSWDSYEDMCSAPISDDFIGEVLRSFE